MSELPLVAQARTFATEISQTVQALVPDCAPFAATALETHVTVGQVPATGIPLCVNGVPVLTLKVSFRCVLDSTGTFLAVEKSSFVVFEGAKGAGEPLFRYDYVRTASAQIPAAHLQVHAHRDAFTYVMARTGGATRRGKRRTRSTEVPHIAQLHFPLGGHRFRPCLEDLLGVLVSEFGVDSTADGLKSLAYGRERWRRQQTRSVVRDAPDEAVTILRELGYDVVEPDEPRPASVERLRAL